MCRKTYLSSALMISLKKNIADLAAVDEVYGTFFPEGTPARRVVGVSELPKNALIQIEAIAGNAEGTPPIVK